MIQLDGVGLSIRDERAGRGRDRAPALQQLDLGIQAGAFRWLLGPAGSGKTALLRILDTSLAPTSGRVRVLGVDPARATRRELSRLRRGIGVIRERPVLLPSLSAFENVALPLRIDRVAPNAAGIDAAEMLEWVGLGQRMHVAAALLSSGERQLCSIARAVAGRPSLLLADEPGQFLSDREGGRLLQLLVEMNRLGATVIVATRNEDLRRHRPAASIRLLAGRIVAAEPDPRAAAV